MAAGPERSLATPTPDSGFTADAAFVFGGVAAAADLPAGAVAPSAANPDAPRAEKGSALSTAAVDSCEGVVVSADLAGADAAFPVASAVGAIAIVGMGLIGVAWLASDSSRLPKGSVAVGGVGAAGSVRPAPSKPDHSSTGAVADCPHDSNGSGSMPQLSPVGGVGVALGGLRVKQHRSSPRRLALVVAGSGAVRHDEIAGASTKQMSGMDADGALRPTIGVDGGGISAADADLSQRGPAPRPLAAGAAGSCQRSFSYASCTNSLTTSGGQLLGQASLSSFKLANIVARFFAFPPRGALSSSTSAMLQLLIVTLLHLCENA